MAGNGKKLRTREHRPARTRRLIAEALEARRLFSASPFTLYSSDSALTLYSASAGASNISLANDGSLWYTLNSTRQRIMLNAATADGATSTADYSNIGSTGNLVITSGLAHYNGLLLSTSALGVRPSSSSLDQYAAATVALGSAFTVGGDTRNLLVSSETLWFTQGNDAIGHLTEGGEVALIHVPAASEFLGIARGGDGNIWFAGEDLSGHGLVGRVTAGGDVKTFNIGTTPTDLAAGSDGDIYFSGGEFIWRISAAGDMTRIVIPGGSVHDLVPATDGSVWFIDTQRASDPISRLEPDGTLSQFANTIPGHPMPDSLLVAPDGNVWFTAQVESVGWIARLNVAAASPVQVIMTSEHETTTPASVTATDIAAAEAMDKADEADAPAQLKAGVHGAVESAEPVTGTEEFPISLPNHAELVVGPMEVMVGEKSIPVPVKIAEVGVMSADNGASENTRNLLANDPARFEGEFGVAMTAKLPPHEEAPPNFYRYELSAAPAIRQGAAVVPGVVDGTGASNARVAASDEAPGSENIQQPAESSIPVASVALSDEAVSQTQVDWLAKWWRVGACISAVTGLQLFRRTSPNKSEDKRLAALDIPR